MEQKTLTEHIARLYKDFKKTAELKFELLKIEIIEIIVSIYSRLITIAVAGAIFTLVFLFLFIALSLYLGELWGHYYLGFLASAGGLFLIFLIFLIFRKSLITNPLLNTFLAILFNTDNYGNNKKKISGN